MPPIGSMPSAPAAAFSGLSATTASVVRNRPAMDAAFCRAERVTFTGHVTDPLTEAADADIVVHYSRLTEPFGQVVAEAMAAGRVVVAARAGGPTELIVDRENGVLVPPRRPDLLAVALDSLIADWELREQLSAAARDRGRDLDLKTSAAIADSLLARVARDVR